MTKSKKIAFSVIIPCHNEGSHLKQCLYSLKKQDYPKSQFEIIIVDNGSTDLSPQIAQQYGDHVLYLPDVKVGAVRNAGADIASGKHLVFIDADCTLDAQWLNRANVLVSKSPNVVFGGGILLPENANWIERHWLLEGPEGNTLPSELIGCSIIIKSKIFKSIQGFDINKSSGEDTDISNRLREKGVTINLTRKLNVTHLGNAKTIKDYMKRQSWHAKSYNIKAKNRLKDPVYALVIMHILLTISTLAFLTVGLWSLAFFSLSITLTLPLILTIKRFYRAKRKPKRCEELFLAYILDLAYLTGRAIGYLTPPYR